MGKFGEAEGRVYSTGDSFRNGSCRWLVLLRVCQLIVSVKVGGERL